MFNKGLEPVTDSGCIFNKIERIEDIPQNRMSFAFSKRVAYEIKDGACWTCEISGKKAKDGWKMDAGHRYTHDKKDPRYNNPENGMCICLEEHLKQHIELYQEALCIGDEAYIDWAYHSTRLIARRCYREGLRTLDHYAESPLDIIDDRDTVVGILTDNDLNPSALIL